MENWFNYVKKEVEANGQSVSLGWEELKRVNTTVIIQQIYD